MSHPEGTLACVLLLAMILIMASWPGDMD